MTNPHNKIAQDTVRTKVNTNVPRSAKPRFDGRGSKQAGKGHQKDTTQRAGRTGREAGTNPSEERKLTEREELSNHILRCLRPQGMRGLKLMTGANNFTLLERGISFRFKGSGKANHIKVTLNGKDYFDMTLSKIRGVHVATVLELRDVAVEELRNAFREETGLETQVPKITGINA